MREKADAYQAGTMMKGEMREKFDQSPLGQASLTADRFASLRPIRYRPPQRPRPAVASLSVIIPSYNEEATVGQCIHSCLEVLEGLSRDFEIIVVDDGSRDGTRQVVRGLQTLAPDRIRVLSHAENMGKAEAIRTGLRYASKDIVVIQDADLEYPPREIPKLMVPLLDGYDVVYGSRFLGSPDGMPLSHRFGNRVVTLTNNLIYGTNFTDVMTGHKMFRRAALADFPFRSSRFVFEVEATATVVERNLNIAEVPVAYQRRQLGEAKIRWVDGIRCVLWLVGHRVKRALLRERTSEAARD